MKKLLTGIVAGVATITLGASCVLAATQFNENNSVKGNNFPICYPNCDMNYVDKNENEICDNIEEESCPIVQNAAPANEESTDNQEDYIATSIDNNESESYDSIENEVASTDPVTPAVSDVEAQNTPEPYYCPDCGGDYIDNNGNGICDNIEQQICPPAQNTEIQGGNQPYYCPDNCGSNYVDNNGNGICDNIEQGICPPAQNTTGNGYYGHHGNHHSEYYPNNTQQNNNYNYGHHGGHCRR